MYLNSWRFERTRVVHEFAIATNCFGLSLRPKRICAPIFRNMSSIFQRFKQRFKSTDNTGGEASAEVRNVPQIIESPAVDPPMEESREEAANEEQEESMPSTSHQQPSERMESVESQPDEATEETRQVDEEVASTIPDEPQPSRWRDDLYIQTRSKSKFIIF